MPAAGLREVRSENFRAYGRGKKAERSIAQLPQERDGLRTSGRYGGVDIREGKAGRKTGAQKKIPFSGENGGRSERVCAGIRIYAGRVREKSVYGVR